MALELPPIIQTIENRVKGQRALERQHKLLTDFLKTTTDLEESYKKQKSNITALAASWALFSDRAIRSSRAASTLGGAFKSLGGAMTDMTLIPLLPFFTQLIGPMASFIDVLANNPIIAGAVGGILLLGKALHSLMLNARIMGFVWHESFTKKIQGSIPGIGRAMRGLDFMRGRGGGGMTGGGAKIVLSDYAGRALKYAKENNLSLNEVVSGLDLFKYLLIGSAATGAAASIPTGAAGAAGLAGAIPGAAAAASGVTLAGAAAFAGIATLVVAAVVGLTRAWDSMMHILEPAKNALERLFAPLGGLTSLLVIIKIGWDGLVTAFEVGWNLLAGNIGLIISLFTGDLPAAWETAKRMFSGVVDALYNLGSRINDLTGGALTRIAVFFRQTLPDAIAEMFNKISGFFSGIGGGVKNLFTKGHFATGTRYVPETGMYTLHRGERVVPADQSKTINGSQSVVINYYPTYANEAFGFSSRLSQELRYGFVGSLGSLRT